MSKDPQTGLGTVACTAQVSALLPGPCLKQQPRRWHVPCWNQCRQAVDWLAGKLEEAFLLWRLLRLREDVPKTVRDCEDRLCEPCSGLLYSSEFASSNPLSRWDRTTEQGQLVNEDSKPCATSLKRNSSLVSGVVKQAKSATPAGKRRDPQAPHSPASGERTIATRKETESMQSRAGLTQAPNMSTPAPWHPIYMHGYAPYQ